MIILRQHSHIFRMQFGSVLLNICWLFAYRYSNETRAREADFVYRGATAKRYHGQVMNYVNSLV